MKFSFNKNNSNSAIDGIVCSVVSCSYNDKDGKCTAKQVEIGPMRATCCAETVCATFKPDSEQVEGRIF